MTNKKGYGRDIREYNERLTQEERIKNARKAGIASGKARRRLRDLQRLCDAMIASAETQWD